MAPQIRCARSSGDWRQRGQLPDRDVPPHEVIAGVVEIARAEVRADELVLVDESFVVERPRRCLEHRNGAGERGDVQLRRRLQQRSSGALRIRRRDVEEMSLGRSVPLRRPSDGERPPAGVSRRQDGGGQVDGGGDEVARFRTSVAETADDTSGDAADAVDES